MALALNPQPKYDQSALEAKLGPKLPICLRNKIVSVSTGDFYSWQNQVEVIKFCKTKLKNALHGDVLPPDSSIMAVYRPYKADKYTDAIITNYQHQYLQLSYARGPPLFLA